ncbi:DUF4314 domain-containing protein [Bacillota bacterium LCP21S3_G6]|jgi:hypothetical protein
MMLPTKAEIECLRVTFPAGTRIELIEMDDPQAPAPGTKGTVNGVDDTGSLLVHWDSGSSLNVIYGIDKVRKVL